jgi:hypothetical protein
MTALFHIMSPSSFTVIFLFDAIYVTDATDKLILCF